MAVLLKQFVFMLLGLFIITQELFCNHFSSPQVDINIAHTQIPENDGEIYIVFTFKPKNGWHLYWENPGDSGKAPQIEFNLPEHASYSFLGFPPPTLLKNKQFTSYGYKNQFSMVFQINAKQKLIPEDIKFNVTWLSCKEMCIPQEFSSALDNKDELTIKQAQFEADKLPQDLFKGSVSHYKDNIIIHYFPEKNEKVCAMYFFPKEHGIISTDARQELSTINEPQIKHLLKIKALSSKDRIEGVILIKTDTEKQYFIIDHDITQSDIFEEETIFMLFLISLLGGLILNLMPCVFPVLSLKIMGLVQNIHTPKSILKHGIAYTLGIFLSLMILFGIVVILKSAGYSVGWGFQLQSPIFISFLIILFSILFFNTFGLFEIHTIQTDSSLGSKIDNSKTLSSFLNGVLTTIVSTPCSAPFMGSAIAVALSQTYLESFFIFSGLALGLASPFLFISFYPKALSFIPKPGAWMQTLKEFLAFPFLGAIIWLLWILESLKPLLIIPVLVLVFAMAIVFWFIGTRQRYGKKTLTYFFPVILTFFIFWLSDIKNTTTFLLIALITFSLAYTIISCFKNQTMKPLKNFILNVLLAMFLAFPISFCGDKFRIGESSENALPYSEEIIAESLKKGQPVFVNYTARWCLTCQINKTHVLSSQKIKDAFKNYNVVYLEADWTNHSPFITESLQKFKRESIPFYVLLIPGQKKPIILPELLTEKIVLDSLKKIK